jgi:hypothetical protein
MKLKLMVLWAFVVLYVSCSVAGEPLLERAKGGKTAVDVQRLDAICKDCRTILGSSIADAQARQDAREWLDAADLRDWGPHRARFRSLTADANSTWYVRLQAEDGKEVVVECDSLPPECQELLTEMCGSLKKISEEAQRVRAELEHRRENTRRRREGLPTVEEEEAKKLQIDAEKRKTAALFARMTPTQRSAALANAEWLLVRMEHSLLPRRLSNGLIVRLPCESLNQFSYENCIWYARMAARAGRFPVWMNEHVQDLALRGLQAGACLPLFEGQTGEEVGKRLGLQIGTLGFSDGDTEFWFEEALEARRRFVKELDQSTDKNAYLENSNSLERLLRGDANAWEFLPGEYTSSRARQAASRAREAALIWRSYVITSEVLKFCDALK